LCVLVSAGPIAGAVRFAARLLLESGRCHGQRGGGTRESGVSQSGHTRLGPPPPPERNVFELFLLTMRPSCLCCCCLCVDPFRSGDVRSFVLRRPARKMPSQERGMPRRTCPSRAAPERRVGQQTTPESSRPILDLRGGGCRDDFGPAAVIGKCEAARCRVKLIKKCPVCDVLCWLWPM